MAQVLLTREEAANYLRISLETLDEMIKMGQIKAIRLSKKIVRIPSAELERIITP